MNTYSTSATAQTPTVASILKVMEDFQFREKVRKTIALGKKEGVVYVGPGVEDADLAKLLPGVEIRHVPYMKQGQIAAMDMSELRKLWQEAKCLSKLS